MYSPKPFNVDAHEPNIQRMQTSPAGTYSGMFHCAGGILKNEGPLAFYKVNAVGFAPESCGLEISIGDIGNTVTVARHRTVCFDPIWWTRVFETNIFLSERLFGDQ